jgi:hypothetical protein
MIKVTDRFYIDANTNCYVLKEKTVVQDKESKNYGQDSYKDLGYYTSLESCLRGILKTTTREYIAKQEEANIYDLIKEIKQAEEHLKSLKLEV